MLIKEEYLVIINAKNRIQRVLLKLEQDAVSKVFKISRITGQYGGKETKQPELLIDKGKVKRTPSEQATLQYNALLKNYLDKGYVKLSALTDKQYQDLNEDEIKILLGGNCVSDQSGIPKPMLAKLADQCSSDIWDKEWFVSRKLDGIRALMYYKDGEIHTASRGGGEYDVATTHLRTNPELLKIFSQKPDLILDGELYHHGTDWPLQRISGLARLKEWKDECSQLEYWIYDYISNEKFRDRLTYLNSIKEQLSDNSPIKILEQKSMTGYLEIKKEHDKYVKEGFEGLCARNPDREYGINKRSAIYLIKLKEYKDDEFEVIGVKEGLRDEDMCFVLKTAEGKEFSAKPSGDVSTRKYYLAHPDEFIGKMATCKYFYYSKDGIPLQPILKNFRASDE